MKKIFTKKWFIISAVVVVVVVGIVLSRRHPATVEMAQVTRGTLVQEVSITGSVKPVESVELSFEHGGRIASVPATVGDRVVAGQTMLSLDATNDLLSLKQAQATLAADEATLLKLKQGTRPEDLAVLQSKYNAAASTNLEAQKSLTDKIKDGYTRADDAVRNYGDQFFDNPRSSSAQINITVTDTQFRNNINADRVKVETVLTSWQASLASSAFTGGLSAASDARANLTVVSAFLDELALAVNALTPTQTLSQTTINTYRSNISTARASVNTALSNLSAVQDSWVNASADLDIADKNLKVGLAGSAPEDIAAADARVQGDEANIDSIRHTIATASLRAPFTGVVTKQDGKIGAVVAANVPLVSLIGEGGFQIESNVPEADIAKLFVGASTSVTLDAYGGDVVFAAVISKIDPAETLIDNVATYKVTFNFLKSDPRIRSGMTANLDVQTAKKEGVLLVPVRAVVERNGTKIVRLPTANGTTTERQVQTGLKSSDGQIEILSGLLEGQSVVVGSK